MGALTIEMLTNESASAAKEPLECARSCWSCKMIPAAASASIEAHEEKPGSRWTNDAEAFVVNRQYIRRIINAVTNKVPLLLLSSQAAEKLQKTSTYVLMLYFVVRTGLQEYRTQDHRTFRTFVQYNGTVRCDDYEPISTLIRSPSS